MNRPLLDTPYSIGSKQYSFIKFHLLKMNVNNILEFGSGVSTVHLSLDFPNSNIISIEDDITYFKETLNLLDRYRINNVKLLFFELKFVRIQIKRFLTYNLKDFNTNLKIDFVLIDGPVERRTLRGREAPLYFVFPYLKRGALIALDDYHRKSSKKVVKNWLKSYKGNLILIEQYERICFLKKIDDQAVSIFNVSSCLDNWYVNCILEYRKLKIKLKDIILFICKQN